MSRPCTALFVLMATCLGGCATTKQRSAPDFDLPKGEYKLVIMPPDVAVSALTAAGKLQPRDDWSGAARDHIAQSLDAFAQARPRETRFVRAPGDAGVSPATLLDLERLHEAVGASILQFKFTDFATLPTKRHAFDWTLGELATRYGAQSRYQYALFIYARDSFGTPGRSALRAISFVGCAFNALACFVNPAGGRQVAFASLVDLRTGNVVWFNALHSPVGDIRDPEGADDLVKHLLRPLGG